MQDKLQELTDKLYNEGLSKGKAEGEAILAKANEEAGKIIDRARDEALSITDKARKEAEDLTAKVRSDLKMASEQALQATRNDIENLLVGKMAGEGVRKALSDPDYVKSIITTVAGKFDASQQCDLALILPESMKEELEPFVSGELSRILGKKVSAEFSRKTSGGFSIGPKDGSWFISLTEDTFKSLIGNYLRPATKKLLFGE